jgi:thymidylate kinase
MIIIIEGPDGSGKTTLAQKIALQAGYEYVHNIQPMYDGDDAYMAQMYADLIKSHSNLVLDRAWYSEMAYGPTMRDHSSISYPDMYWLEELVAKKGGMIIYCTDNVSTLWKRCQRRGEDYVVHKADFVDICEAFKEIMSVPHLIPVVKYDYKDL